MVFPAELTEHYLSFRQMMSSFLCIMRYTPTEGMWHTINHFLPCIGLPAYSYAPCDSLVLCDKIEQRLEQQTMILHDDIFLVGQYKTACRVMRRRRRRVRPPDPKPEIDDNSVASDSSEASQGDVVGDVEAGNWDDASSDEEKPDGGVEPCLVNPWHEGTEGDVLENNCNDSLLGEP